MCVPQRKARLDGNDHIRRPVLPGRCAIVPATKNSQIPGMHDAVISGTGLWVAPEVITNEELVASYNAYAQLYNAQHAAAIAAAWMFVGMSHRPRGWKELPWLSDHSSSG